MHMSDIYATEIYVLYILCIYKMPIGWMNIRTYLPPPLCSTTSGAESWNITHVSVLAVHTLVVKGPQLHR